MAGKHLSLLVHFVWSTAGREPWIGADWQNDLYGYIGGSMKKKHAIIIIIIIIFIFIILISILIHNYIIYI